MSMTVPTGKAWTPRRVAGDSVKVLAHAGKKERARPMIADERIKSIATANGTSVRCSFSAPATDVHGNDALQITIVLTSELSAATVPPDAALKTPVQVLTSY